MDKKTKKSHNKLKTGKIRGFIKKNKRLSLISFLLASAILALIIYRLWLNIHFFITDDLILNLEPQDVSLSIHYLERPNVTMGVDIENSFFCDTLCRYEFKDISNNDASDTGSFTSKGIGKGFEKDFQLSVDRIGTGQKLYSFEVQCNNVRTWHCLTNENKRKRSSFITLNYDISEYEQFLKQNLKDNITKIIDALDEVDSEIQSVNDRFFKLGFSLNFNELEDDKDVLNNDYNKIVLELENIGRVWSEEDYLLLLELYNRSFDTRIHDILLRITALDSEIGLILEKHNSLIEQVKLLDNNIRPMNETLLFLHRAGNNLLHTHKNTINEIRKLKNTLHDNTFESYSLLENRISDIRKSIDEFEIESKKDFTNAYLEGSYDEILEKDILCSIKGVCLDKDKAVAAIADSHTTNNSKISNICSSLETIKAIYEKENAASEILLRDYDLEKIQKVLESAKTEKIYLLRTAIFNDIKKIAPNEKINYSLNVLLNISSYGLDSPVEKTDYGNFSEEEVLSLAMVSLSNSSARYSGNFCREKNQLNFSGHLGNETPLDKVSNIEDKKFNSRVEITLTENYPVCCVFGVCKKCCTDIECKQDPELYPVLFLHGHSFNSDNSPDYSLDAFNNIQTKLFEDGYITAGTITPTSDYTEIHQGEWGLSSKPISVKGSYYLVSYYNIGSYAIATQKSENIETYAIRLKELIDLLKFRTGKDKVNIIAHSMGGLVARSYIQIFGDNAIDKLILISVPNKGISGRVSSYCTLLGEKKECSDMSENSILIKKMNDPNKIPENAKITNIVGIGCDMDGKDGDGVVKKENAELNFSKNHYINGACPGLEVLHTKILNTNIYPKVYEIVSSTLKS
jgi:uncharacterized alpha/beta hydrolase family protein